MEVINKTGKKKSAFQLNLCTNGFCFLCLKPTNLPTHSNTRIKMEAMEGIDVTGRRSWSEELSSTPPTSPLLKHLCRHLKINIAKIATEVIRTPAIIEKMGLTSIEKADMKVTLCGLCSSITEKFSSLFVELERIKIETDHCLTRIQTRMTAAEEDAELFNTYQESMAGDIHSLLLSGFIDELKKEITRKCAQTSSLQESSKMDPDGSSSLSKTTAKTPPIPSTMKNVLLSAQATTRMVSFPENDVPLNDSHAELINISDSEDEEGGEMPDNDKPADEGSHRQEASASPETESNATTSQENIIIFPLHSPPLPKSSKRSKIPIRPPSPSVVALPLNQEEEDSSNTAELVDIGDSCEENDDKENEEVNDLINIGLATSASTSKSSVLPIIKKQKTYKCKLCEKTFPRLIDVRVHKKKSHTAPAMPISIISSPPPPQLSRQNQNIESSNERSGPRTLQTENPSTVILSPTSSSPAEAILGAEKKAKFSKGNIQSSGSSSATGNMEMVQGAMSNQETENGMNNEEIQHEYDLENIQVAPLSQQQFKVPPQPKRLKRFSEGSQLIGNHFLLEEQDQAHLSSVPPKQKRSKRTSEGSSNGWEKYVLDETTRKYKCVEASCTTQFTSKAAAHRHNQAMHLMIRYKCGSCGRDDFRYTFLLTKHQNNCTRKVNESTPDSNHGEGESSLGQKM